METVKSWMNLDDIVFENREQRYGAYQIRKEYGRNLLLGCLIIFGIFMAGTAGVLWLYDRFFKVQNEWKGGEGITLSELPVVPKSPEPPKTYTPPAPPVPEQEKPGTPAPPVATTAFKIPEPKPVSEIKEPESTMKSIDSLANNPISTEDNAGGKAKNPNDFGFQGGKTGGKGGNTPVAPVVDMTDRDHDKVIDSEDNCPDEPGPPSNKGCPVKPEKPEWEIFVPVNKRPTPVNMEEIRALIHYPEPAREVEGEVILKVKIDKEGNYVKHIVLKPLHPILLREVEKNISKLRFTPAIQGNQPVEFWMVVPFKFVVQ